MIVEKTNKAGIDLVVYYFQQKLYANLLGFFNEGSTYECYPRANKNYKGNDKVPEVSLDQLEYKEVMYDDNFSLTSFFITDDQREWQNENGFLSHELSIIFQADLVQLYGMSERMDERFLEQVLKVLRPEMKFKQGDIQISEGIDLVYQGFTLSNDLKNRIKYSDVGNRYVVKFSFNVLYPIGCTSPVVAVCAPVNIIKDGELFFRAPAGSDYEYSTACASATITVNSNAFATVESGDSLNVGVAYQTSETNPIHSIVGSNIFITDPVVLPTNKIYIRPVPTGEIYVPASAFYPDYCDGWRVFTGQDISTQPTSGIPMLVDKSKRWKLAHTDNVFGNRFRLTGLTGGYYDPELANYYTASGVLSTYGEAFPNDYFIDHSTGLGGMTKANSGNITWASALTEIHSLSYAGFTGYFMPNEEEHCSIIDLGYATPLGAGATANPIFSLSTNSNKWTSTTVKGLETRAWVMQPNGDPANNILKSGVARYMAFRYHFNNS